MTPKDQIIEKIDEIICTLNYLKDHDTTDRAIKSAVRRIIIALDELKGKIAG